MLKISNFEVAGWEHAIRGMRNPIGIPWETLLIWFYIFIRMEVE